MKKHWTELPLTKPHCAPAAVKLSRKTADELEAKVAYQSGAASQDAQVYSVSLYVFLPEQLAAVSDNVYSHLTQNVRLHTPKVSLAALRSETGGGYLSAKTFDRQLEELLAMAAADAQEKHRSSSSSSSCTADGSAKAVAKRKAVLVKSLIQGLQLYACVFRSSLRRVTKELRASVKAGDAASLAVTAKACASLVFDVCGVLQRFDSVGRSFALPQLPDELQEECALVDEFLLFEADRALMKLLRSIDKRLSGDELRARPTSADPATGQAAQEHKQQLPGGCAMRHTLSGLARSAEAAISRGRATAAPSSRSASQEELAGLDALSEGRHMLGSAIIAMEDMRTAHGYWESIMHENDKHHNESFTYRLKLLKRNVRRAVSLAPKTETPSFWFADLMGSIFAAIAMALACATIIFAQRATKGTRYTLVFSVILVVGYVIKDRIKEWGKRYLQPMGTAIGIRFPDRIRKLHDYTGKVVGRCEEQAEVLGSSRVPRLVLDARHADKGSLRSRHPAVQPERVIRYKKRVTVQWGKLGQQLQHTSPDEGLDDVMVLDLGFLCRRMQPPVETHHKLWCTEEGDFGVEKVLCARVYHINIVAAVASLAKGADERSMVIQRALVVMDKAAGILRIEGADSQDLQRPVFLRPAANAVGRISAAALHTGRAQLALRRGSSGKGDGSGGSTSTDDLQARQQSDGENGEDRGDH